MSWQQTTRYQRQVATLTADCNAVCLISCQSTTCEGPLGLLPVGKRIAFYLWCGSRNDVICIEEDLRDDEKSASDGVFGRVSDSSLG